jgi:signal transduction histidine kinase
MSLKLLRRFRRSFSFRLSVLFATGFILSSLLLFGFAYFLVSSSLQANDRTAIQLKLKEYADEYQKNAILGVKTKVESDANSGTLRPFMVRLASPHNDTIFLKPPAEGVNYDFKQLEQNTDAESSPWIHLKAPDEDDVLDIASFRFPDQNVLQIGKGPEDREDLLDQFQNTFLTVLLGMVILSVAVGTFLARQALRPVRGLISVLGPIIDTGNIKARIPVISTTDEFEELTIRFNQALERIDALIEAMKASLDNAAHDLRTPMTRLRGVAEMALKSEADPERYMEALSDCLEESDQVLQMLNMLMDISEVEAGSLKLDLREVNVLGMLNDACELYSCVAEEKNITVQVECPKDIFVSGDRNRVLQVMANLMDNAIKYTPAGGQVNLAANKSHDEIIIEVKDSGIGIAPEDLPKIWDRLYRGDKSRTQRGLGLGLSLVKAVIQAHKGNIKVFTEQSQGCRFVICLPAAVRTSS